MSFVEITYVVPEQGTNGQGYLAGATVTEMFNLDHISIVQHYEGRDFIEIGFVHGEWRTVRITIEAWKEAMKR